MVALGRVEPWPEVENCDALAALEGAAWLAGFGRWVDLSFPALAARDPLFRAVVDAEAEHIDAQWSAIERALPILDVGLDGALRFHVPEDPATAISTLKALNEIRWGDPAPDGAVELAP